MGARIKKRRVTTSGGSPKNIDLEPSYDKLARVSKIKHTNVTDTSTLADLVYRYDKVPAPTQITFSHVTGTPVNDLYHDRRNRLTVVDYYDSNEWEFWKYDPSGNRITAVQRDGTDREYDRNQANEYTTVKTWSGGSPTDTKAWSHDAAGNRTDDDAYTYTYDYNNRLTRVVRNSGSVLVAEMNYDALGRRIVLDDKASTKTYRFYHNDRHQELAEYAYSDGTASMTRYFVPGAAYIDELILMHEEAGDEDYYYLQDHTYSVLGLTDDEAALQDRVRYNAYGRFFYTDSGWKTTQANQFSSQGNPYLYTGRRLDRLDKDALPLMYYRARHYDPIAGRFMQRDPIGYQDGMNLYEYVGSDPLSLTDPLGTETFHVDQYPKQFRYSETEPMTYIGPDFTTYIAYERGRYMVQIEHFTGEDDSQVTLMSKEVYWIEKDSAGQYDWAIGHLADVAANKGAKKDVRVFTANVMAGAQYTMMAAAVGVSIISPFDETALVYFAAKHGLRLVVRGGQIIVTSIRAARQQARSAKAIRELLDTQYKVFRASKEAAELEARRGVIGVLENTGKSRRAADYEAALHGATTDVATKRGMVPALRYDHANPSPWTKPYVRFDGVDPQDARMLIDRKLDATMRSGQRKQMRRAAEALRQNPGYQLRIEVPNKVAARNTWRLIERTGSSDVPITVEVVPFP